MNAIVRAERASHRIVRGRATVLCAGVYITRRGSVGRHLADGFSSGLWLARRDPTIGSLWAFDYARGLAPLVPPGTEVLVSPPPAPGRGPDDFDLGRAIAVVVAELSGLPLIDPLRRSGTEPGRTRGPLRTDSVVCTEQTKDRRLCLVDDLLTTGTKLEACFRALRAAGSRRPPTAVMLAATEHALAAGMQHSRRREPMLPAPPARP